MKANIFNVFIVLYIFESILNTNIYGLNTSFGSVFSILINALIIVLGMFAIFKLKFNFVTKSLLAFILITLLSTIVNKVNFINFLEFFLRYGQIYFLLSIGLYFNKDIGLKSIFKTLTLVNLLNFAFNLIFFFEIPIITNKYVGTLDFATGILGDALYQCLLSSLVLVMSIFMAKNTSFKHKFLVYLNIVTSLVQIYWSYSYHFYIVIVLAVIIFLFWGNQLKVFNKILISTILITITSFLISNSDFFTNSFTTLASTSPKIASYRDLFNGEYQNSFQEIIGVGPGQGGSYIGIENNSIIAENYFSIYSYFTDKLRRGSITTLPNTGITTLKSELGYLGLFNFLILLILTYYRLNVNLSKKNYPLIQASKILIVVFFLENIFADYLQHSLFPLITFLLAGISIEKK